MDTIKKGNLDTEVASHPETKGWVLGHFMEKYPEFLSHDVELKWARHKKGYKKPGLKTASSVKTFVILIEGKFVVRFPELNDEAVLSKRGDFAFYDSVATSHEAEVLEDCLLLVVRYPSIK